MAVLMIDGKDSLLVGLCDQDNIVGDGDCLCNIFHAWIFFMPYILNSLLLEQYFLYITTIFNNLIPFSALMDL